MLFSLYLEPEVDMGGGFVKRMTQKNVWVGCSGQMGIMDMDHRRWLLDTQTRRNTITNPHIQQPTQHPSLHKPSYEEPVH